MMSDRLKAGHFLVLCMVATSLTVGTVCSAETVLGPRTDAEVAGDKEEVMVDEGISRGEMGRDIGDVAPLEFEAVRERLEGFDKLLPRSEDHRMIVWQCYDFDIVDGKFIGHCVYKFAFRNMTDGPMTELVGEGDCPHTVWRAWYESGEPIDDIGQEKVGEKSYTNTFPLEPPLPKGKWGVVYLYSRAGARKVWYEYPHHVEWTKVGERQSHRLGRGTGKGLATVERFILPTGAKELQLRLLPRSVTTSCQTILSDHDGRAMITFVANNPTAPEYLPYKMRVEFTVGE